jgi:uroporphyrinogen-III synthase
MLYLLSPKAHQECVHLPMITFTIIEQILAFDSYDLLLFTSKQAVRSAEQLNPLWKEIPVIAIGDATAKEVKNLGGSLYYQPDTFYAKSVGEDIIEKFSNKNILYLRPKKVSFDTKNFLAQAGITLHEKIIYETSCISYRQEDRPPNSAIIIFTSPSTIHCFLKNFSWNDTYKAVVIGKSTKAHLPLDAKCFVADSPSIEACISKAKEILLTSNSK